jgi:dTDP-4-amino-4,6-dideoxygalactose transaminase
MMTGKNASASIGSAQLKTLQEFNRQRKKGVAHK